MAPPRLQLAALALTLLAATAVVTDAHVTLQFPAPALANGRSRLAFQLHDSIAKHAQSVRVLAIQLQDAPLALLDLTASARLASHLCLALIFDLSPLKGYPAYSMHRSGIAV